MSKPRSEVATLHESDNTILHRFSAPQEGIRQRYRNHGALTHAIYLREAIQNAVSHGATWVKVISLMLPVGGSGATANYEPYVVVTHNGRRFAKRQHLEAAFYPNTSIGTKGGNGAGGKLSGTLLVDRNQHYHHLILSRNSDSSENNPANFNLYGGKIRMDRSIEVHNEDERLPEIITRLGTLLEGANVAYITRYKPKMDKNAFLGLQNDRTMALLRDFAPDLTSKAHIEYWKDMNLRPNEKFDKQFEKDISWRKNSIKNVDDFDAAFLYRKYDLPTVGCSWRYGDVEIGFTAIASLKLFHGVYKRDDDGSEKRFGLVVINEDAKDLGYSNNNAVFPLYKSFVTWPWQTDQTLERLCKQPSHASNLTPKIASILSARIFDTEDIGYDDMDQFEELLPSIEASKNAKHTSKFYRKPFYLLKISVESISRITEKGKDVRSQFAESDIREAFGIVDEMFMQTDKNRGNQMIVEVLNGVIDNPQNSHKLNALRKDCNRIFPKKDRNLAKLSNPKPTDGFHLRFTDSEGGEPHTRAKANQRFYGKLMHADTGVAVDPNWKFEPYKNSKNRLLHEGDGIWCLKIANYHVRCPETGEFVAASEAEFQKGALRATLPETHVCFVSNAHTYTLNTRVDLPHRFDFGQGNTKRAPKGASAGEIKMTDAMYKAMQPPSRYVEFRNGTTFLNEDNEDVRVLFAEIAEKADFRDKFWKEVQKETEHAARIAASIRYEGWSDTETAQKAKTEWQEASYDDYLIDQIVAKLFKSDRIQKRMDEIRNFLATDQKKAGEPTIEGVAEVLP
jgi:hypothetical protein